MSETTCRKTYKEKLRPTPARERALEEVLWRCRELYNTALEQRITAWQLRRVSVSRYQQEAELKEIRAEFPEYAAIHSPHLARRVGAARQDLSGILPSHPTGREGGLPRFKGRTRFHSFTFKEYGNGARLDNGALVLSKIGRIRVHWIAPARGDAQDRHDLQRGRWLVCRDLVRGRARCSRCRRRARRRASTWAWSPSPRAPTGSASAPPRTTARPRRICAAVNGALPGARRAATAEAKPWRLLGQSAAAHRTAAA